MEVVLKVLPQVAYFPHLTLLESYLFLSLYDQHFYQVEYIETIKMEDCAFVFRKFMNCGMGFKKVIENNLITD